MKLHTKFFFGLIGTLRTQSLTHLMAKTLTKHFLQENGSLWHLQN